MPLSSGSRLGPYEILAPLGAGGMGEVYRARDTRLDRTVAIKILRAERVGREDSKTRFIQEAKAASALNHPNIVTVYDIGADQGVDYIAMEFVAGKTLDQLIGRNGMRLSELLRYAVQAADALAKAHAAGIVHRDLKPGNIMVTGDGLVKVLDFGLAKLSKPAAEEGATRTMHGGPGEGAGVIMGTAAYMSPEQAEAREADSRSDIFAFGAVLYEMASGQPAFRGDTQISTLSAVLRDDPKPVTELRIDTPNELGRIIARCLRKDPARRFQHMDDLKVALEELKEESESGKLVATPVAAPPARGAKRYLAAAAMAGALAVGALAVWYFAMRPQPDMALRAVPLTSYRGYQEYPSFSPDGDQVAFSWDGEKQDNFDIYIKLIGSGAPLRLTTDPAVDVCPKWSPDGRSIAFLRQATAGKFAVMTVAALGGQERKLGELDGPAGDVSWAPDGKWLAVAGQIGEQDHGIYLVSAESGEQRKLTNPPADNDGDAFPAFSHDGRSLAFCRFKSYQVSSLYVLPLSAKFEARGEPHLVPTVGQNVSISYPAWTAGDREIIYATVMSPRSLLYRVAASGARPSRPLGLGEGATMPAVSSDGRHLAYAHEFEDANIWRLDLAGKAAAPEQLIASTFREVFPQYSPDGKRIVYYSNRSGSDQIWTCNADGSGAAPLTNMDAAITGTPRWSPDGRQISFDSNAGGRFQVYVAGADGGQPRQLTTDQTNNFGGSWSRDGQWLYFASQRSGRYEVWKMPLGGGAAVQVTRNGGNAALESRDGKTLYYAKDPGSLWQKTLPDGAETPIASSIFRYNVAVAEKGVYYTVVENNSATIVFRDSATGKATPILKMAKAPDLGLEVSPDGRFLLFVQLDYSGSDLKLVENFR